MELDRRGTVLSWHLGGFMTYRNDEFDTRPAFSLVAPGAEWSGQGFYLRVGKRLADIIIALLVLPVIVPILVLFSVLIMLGGGNPFYFQERVGRGGRSFRMWKLRSMVPNAEEALRQLLASDPVARAEWETNQKLKRDPRIPRTGRFIRKFSIDELPQVWNVLRGDMSIVGPRPMLPQQRAAYRGGHYYRFRPGITGLWQVSGRNDCSFAARAEFDRTYADRVSALTDLMTILATVKVVLRGTGY